MSLLAKLIARNSKPLPRLDLAHPLVRELRAAFRALDAMPLGSKKEVESWYDAANAFRARLSSDWTIIYDSLPHELEHYLDDADIRAKDAGYADYQRKILAAFLAPEEPIQASETTRGK